MRTVLKILIYLLVIILLTLLTQVGGLMLLMALIVAKYISWSSRWKTPLLFIGMYLFVTFLILPPLAPAFGREPVRPNENLAVANFMTVLLNRNFVTPELNEVLTAASESLKDEGITIYYLEANFPFIDGFPLLPHLSHDDGEKVDLSFVYENEDGTITNKLKSISGYGVYEVPLSNEFDQAAACEHQGYFQYSFSKYLTFGKVNDELTFSSKGTKKLIQALLKEKVVGKVFIEPHLKHRMGIKNEKLRFHGCRAVRHDDHIHVQMN